MYLTKLEIPLSSRKTARILGDGQSMHRLISKLFESQRMQENVLYRIRTGAGCVQIYLYSDSPTGNLPEGVTLAGQRDLSGWLDALEAGQCWHFDLLTMPSKKVPQSDGGKNSRRRVLREPVQRRAWLERKAQQNGFLLLQAEELEQGHTSARHPQDRGGMMYLDSYHYQGMLQIADADLFRKAVSHGIGPGKAYGLGMMLLR